ncbi:thioredoxin family protein [Thiomicrorhabdus aquaedulcis]|uniref:thioredoxin family protein n=1 Tax=Thiomicrorhabdus aquaedulcis TaxID=2211106 RepID=UPI001E520DC2|nr:thioredoxin fold domain-containing protein [Thiomicrorhabdus aquaedulcis]
MMSTQLLKPYLLSVLLFMLGVSGCNSAAQTQEGHLPELANLQTLGEQARQAQLPIVLMFGAQACHYCDVLSTEIFNPMTLSGLYEGKVAFIRHVGIDEDAPILDFNGQSIVKREWAEALRTDLTPTVVFFDGTGKEIAPRIVGIPEITLYMELVHQGINAAYTNMGLNRQIPSTPDQLAQQQAQQP